MKLVSRKTRKVLEKAVRKAVKKHGPTLVAALATGLASSIAALATAEGTRRRNDDARPSRPAATKGQPDDLRAESRV
jgi:hypothetical protein